MVNFILDLENLNGAFEYAIGKSVYFWTPEELIKVFTIDDELLYSFTVTDQIDQIYAYACAWFFEGYKPRTLIPYVVDKVPYIAVGSVSHYLKVYSEQKWNEWRLLGQGHAHNIPVIYNCHGTDAVRSALEWSVGVRRPDHVIFDRIEWIRLDILTAWFSGFVDQYTTILSTLKKKEVVINWQIEGAKTAVADALNWLKGND